MLDLLAGVALVDIRINDSNSSVGHSAVWRRNLQNLPDDRFQFGPFWIFPRVIIFVLHGISHVVEIVVRRIL